jgi:hypothetical protein
MSVVQLVLGSGSGHSQTVVLFRALTRYFTCTRHFVQNHPARLCAKTIQIRARHKLLCRVCFIMALSTRTASSAPCKAANKARCFSNVRPSVRCASRCHVVANACKPSQAEGEVTMARREALLASIALPLLMQQAAQADAGAYRMHACCGICDVVPAVWLSTVVCCSRVSSSEEQLERVTAFNEGLSSF